MTRRVSSCAFSQKRKSHSRKASLTSGERLQRRGQISATGIANLIVIGASAGGHRAVVEIFKDFSEDMPAAIVLLLHAPLRSASFLKASLARSSRLPIIEVENRKPLREGSIFILPPGRSAIFNRGVVSVEEEMPERPVTTINRLFMSAPRIMASA